MASLSTFTSVQENFFVELNINGSYSRFSDYHVAYTIDGNSYDALGSLLGITPTKTNIRATAETLGITISGIPSSNLALVYNTNIKGSAITVTRVFFNPITGSALGTTETNPSVRFRGMVNNFSAQETFNAVDNTSTFTLGLEVENILSQLTKKTSGRRTNPLDEKKFFATDISFDRVPIIKNASFDFGKPRQSVKTGTKGTTSSVNNQAFTPQYTSGNPHR